MNSRSSTLGAALLLCALAAPCSPPARATPRPTVIELYTSQGCSSCPPADALLGELRQQPHVLALAFHVDYWDDLGWADRFALPFATQRQRDYAHTLHLASVFTPQLVVEAQRSFVGSDRSGIVPAIAGERDGVAVTIELRGEELSVEVGQAAQQDPADVLLLAVVPEAQTAIGRGENGGRTLREFNIVRASFRLGSWNGSAHRYTLPRAALPAEATAAAVLVQQSGQRAILGAATFTWQ
jgi:hypothetical protein